MLGLYNGQGLDAEPHDDMVSYTRVTEAPEPTFVRVLMLRGRVQGAVLLGETGKSLLVLEMDLQYLYHAWMVNVQ